jgi:hypothetical protein
LKNEFDKIFRKSSDQDVKSGEDDLLLKKEKEYEEALDKLKAEFDAFEVQIEPTYLKLNSGHFHAMISYRVATEGDGASKVATNLHSGMKGCKQKDTQVDNHVPMGQYPDYVKYDGWLDKDPHLREQLNSKYRFFLDTLCLREGYDWAKAFSRAVCNSLVFLPILSCHKEEAKGGTTANGGHGDKKTESDKYTGSVGQMVDWDPVGDKDRVDNVLLEIAMANALMELPQEERWLHCIVPVFVGKKDDRGNFERFNYQVVKRLSSKASLMTNREVVRRLLSNGYPKDKERLCRILSRSIKDNIQLLLNLQGINMSELGLERYARVLNFVCSFS